MGSHMNTNLQKQLNKEMLIFLGLSVINLIYSAIILAFGIMFIINHIYQFDEYTQIINVSSVYIITGIILSIIGF